MRRIASLVSAFLLITVMVGGCSVFGGKKTEDPQASAAYVEPYPEPVYEEPVEEYDQYSSPAPTPARTVYEPLPAEEPQTSERYHVVEKGDTLYRLARMYYGDQSRWRDLYEANRSKIGDPNKIRVGQRLLIP